MNEEPVSPERPWPHKFRDAFRGIKTGARGQSTFFVHFFFAAAVILGAAVLVMDYYEWCILLLCIAVVLTAEMFNTALESIAKAVSKEHNPHLGDALDIAAGAVLIASTGSTIIGTIIFGYRIAKYFNWT